jgi:hypothetical protein
MNWLSSLSLTLLRNLIVEFGKPVFADLIWKELLGKLSGKRALSGPRRSEIDGPGRKPFQGHAGSMILFECNTPHGSNSNVSCWPRSNLFFVYNSVHNTLEDPYCGNKPRPQFLANRTNWEPLKPV